ncbi:MAG: hypothetical protein FWE14_12915 [Lachnospiraceae bacterium]|nr:hypothetical protein [Lachnospiraceae bacterium]
MKRILLLVFAILLLSACAEPESGSNNANMLINAEDDEKYKLEIKKTERHWCWEFIQQFVTNLEGQCLILI